MTTGIIVDDVLIELTNRQILAILDTAMVSADNDDEVIGSTWTGRVNEDGSNGDSTHDDSTEDRLRILHYFTTLEKLGSIHQSLDEEFFPGIIPRNRHEDYSEGDEERDLILLDIKYKLDSSIENQKDDEPDYYKSNREYLKKQLNAMIIYRDNNKGIIL